MMREYKCLCGRAACSLGGVRGESRSYLNPRTKRNSGMAHWNCAVLHAEGAEMRKLELTAPRNAVGSGANRSTRNGSRDGPGSQVRLPTCALCSMKRAFHCLGESSEPGCCQRGRQVQGDTARQCENWKEGEAVALQWRHFARTGPQPKRGSRVRLMGPGRDEIVAK